jgi:prophage regulatory protein
MAIKFIRLAGVSDAQGGKAKSTIYRDINDGLLPPPLKLGASSVWVESEIEAINQAIIAGKSDDEIRQLVKELVAARTAAGNERTLTGAANVEVHAPAKELPAARRTSHPPKKAAIRGGCDESGAQTKAPGGHRASG